jgi:predicted nucleic acid-binding protein
VSSFSAFLDANVLYSASLRTISLTFASAGYFRPLWSNEVLSEVQRNLFLENQAFGKTFQKHQEYMKQSFPDAITTPAENFNSDEFKGLHPNDTHVLSAAIGASAGALVTFNLRDFPVNLFNIAGIELLHPDAFFMDLVDLNPTDAKSLLLDLHSKYVNPKMPLQNYAQLVARAGCPKLSEFIMLG